MKHNWSKWGFTFWASVMRHTGTAGLAALSICYTDGIFAWKKFGVAVLVGGVIPAVFTFLQNTPVPEDETEPKPKEPTQ